MSTTGTHRGSQSHRSSGRGRVPDFETASASHIPRPQSAATHASSDIGGSTMSASVASSRQRQNQSKRDEVCDPEVMGVGRRDFPWSMVVVEADVLFHD